MEAWAAVSLFLTDGRVVRIGGDESESENQPLSIQWDTSNPGGFGSATVILPRPENLYSDDAKLFSHVEIYGPGAVVYYEGMITGTPQVGEHEIQLTLSGWVTVLDRIQTFREIFVDRDLSRWGEASRQRRLDLLGTFNSVAGPSVEVDTTTSLPALTLTTPATEVNPVAQAVYDAGAGVEVASIYYDMTSLSLSTYVLNIGTMSDEVATASDLSADLLTGTDSSAAGTHTPATEYRYGLISFYLSGGTVGAKDQSVTVRHLTVFGNHGLTKRGTAPDEGYYGSDIIGYVIGQAPSLTYTAGDSVEATSFVIQHLTFTEDTSLRTVVEQVTALGGGQNVANDWGVYDGKEFYWRSPGTYGRSWRVRRDQVATSSSDGPDSDRRCAGVKVLYTDAAGTSKSVGPPGSNSDYETTDLLDSDSDNPAFRIPGAFKVEDIGISPEDTTLGYSLLAVNAGVMILNERNRLDWRGSVSVTGEAEDENGNTYPAALIRAGDRIVISDDNDPTERTIVSTSYDHGSLTCTASIGAAPDSLEVMLGQLAAVTNLIGQ